MKLLVEITMYRGLIFIVYIISCTLHYHNLVLILLNALRQIDNIYFKYSGKFTYLFCSALKQLKIQKGQ